MEVLDWSDYETGPFCRHYSDPFDCDEKCARCGHDCSKHGYGMDDDEPCSVEGCTCKGWMKQE